MSRYSYSQIQLFQTCQLKYRYQYIDKIEYKDDNLSFLLGTSVHSSLERLYNTIFAQRIPELNDLVNYYSISRQEEYAGFSLKYDGVELSEYYNRGLNYLRKYYAHRYPFNQEVFVKSEMNISIELSKDIRLVGKIDRVDICDDALIITDYKTNQHVDTFHQDLHKEQITLYALGIQQKFLGKFNYLQGRILYLHDDKQLIRNIDDSELKTIQDKYLQYSLVIDDTKLRFAFNEPNAFLASIGVQCTSCKFKSICSAHKLKN